MADRRRRTCSLVPALRDNRGRTMEDVMVVFLVTLTKERCGCENRSEDGKHCKAAGGEHETILKLDLFYGTIRQCW